MVEQRAKYGELAEQFSEQTFAPERVEQHEQLRQVARNIVDCFDWKPLKESFLVVTDTKVMRENPIIIQALQHELEAKSQAAQAIKPTAAPYFRIRVTEASPKSATPLGETIGESMRDQPVLIITSMSRSHSPETGAARRGDLTFERADIDALTQSEKFQETAGSGHSTISPEKLAAWGERVPDDVWLKLKEHAAQHRSRIISITKGHNPYDILTKGAVLEKTETLRERADKVRSLMKDVARVRITSPLGTDLWLSVRPDLEEIEDGRVNKPGMISNYPIGEWSCSPDWQGSSGTLVVDGPCGGNINQNILDKSEPLRLTIRDGEIVSAEGGEEALRLWRAYLDGGNNEQNHAYHLAELGIGINGRALEDKPREYWGSSEGEKKYGTCHVAVGSNGTFGREKSDKCYNAALVHCDMVLGLNPGAEVTVECHRKDGSVFTLMDGGKPKDY